MIDEQKLRELCSNATPGPWITEDWASQDSDGAINVCGTSVMAPQSLCGIFTVALDGDGTNDVEFIAAANPATILALLDELETLRSERTALLVNEQNLRGELEECQAQRRAAFRRIEDQDTELEVTKAAMGDPVAAIRSMYGDPESFGEREIVPLRDIQKLRYDTKLYALTNKETK